ncbi:hypothetical protein CYY_001470 [Polysphondylium violaceum]|uniref:UV excision repair protein RAD23 n=1 Tax=Polysphondylium violaceum TaxID=133409 RepID=A0A8J4Q9B3_9MYCE|nr:hypothetical protein CYY_001470 [Polysphondylium violaceum]
MKITIKNMNKETYLLEVDEEATIGDLKNLISEKHNQNPTWQTLIYSGKLLNDDKRTLSSYNIVESGFIVMMIKKPREGISPAAAAPSTPTPTTTTPSNTTTTSTPSTSTTTPVPSNNTPVTPNPTPTTESTPSTSSPSTDTPTTTTTPSSTGFATGAELEATIRNIEAMGFPRDQVMRALRSTFNNAERAVEFLLSGSIPADNDEAGDEDAPVAPTGTGGQSPFDSIRSHPHFPLLREAIQRNPQIIPEILQQLSQSNPELVRQITENPQEFLRIFQGGEGGAPQTGGGQPGTFTIQVTEEENQAIERLQNLTGLDKSEVVEAYFACDKDENLTASYLFERADEPDN